MPDETKTRKRSTYTTDQFIGAYGEWIQKITDAGGTGKVAAALKNGSKTDNPWYDRTKFNEIFMKHHNASHSDETKHIKTVDDVNNTKISQIFTYVKGQLIENGYDKNDILGLPSLRAGARKKDWSSVGTMFGLTKK